MKIVLCLNTFLPKTFGGTEIYVFRLAKFLKNNNYDVIVLKPFLAYYETDFIDKYIYDGLDVYSYYVPDKPTDSIIKGLKRTSGLNNFKKWILNYKPDIIHFHEMSSGLGFTYEHLKIAKALCIATAFTFHRIQYTCFTNELKYLGRDNCDGHMSVHKCRKCSIYNKTKSNFKTNIVNSACIFFDKLGVNFYKYNSRLATALGYTNYIKQGINNFAKLGKYSDVIISLNKWYKNILVLNGISEDKIKIVKQGLMSEYKYERSSNIDADNNKILRLVFIGRDNKEKGLDIIIDAVKSFTNLDYQLDVYGQINLMKFESEFSVKIENLNINFFGTIEPDVVLNTLKNYDFLVIASRVIEMAPLVITEALAAGISIIAPRQESIIELVMDESKLFLFDINKKNGLKEVLSKIIINKYLIRDKKSDKINLRDINDVGNDMIDIYENIMNK